MSYRDPRVALPSVRIRGAPVVPRSPTSPYAASRTPQLATRVVRHRRVLLRPTFAARGGAFDRRNSASTATGFVVMEATATSRAPAFSAGSRFGQSVFE